MITEEQAKRSLNSNPKALMVITSIIFVLAIAIQTMNIMQ